MEPLPRSVSLVQRNKEENVVAIHILISARD
jgi:hypothetical protein